MSKNISKNGKIFAAVFAVLLVASISVALFPGEQADACKKHKECEDKGGKDYKEYIRDSISVTSSNANVNNNLNDNFNVAQSSSSSTNTNTNNAQGGSSTVTIRGSP